LIQRKQAARSRRGTVSVGSAAKFAGEKVRHAHVLAYKLPGDGGQIIA
jgi:hypothetical protein